MTKMQRKQKKIPFFPKNKVIINDKLKQYLLLPETKTSLNLLASGFCDVEPTKHQETLSA